MFGTIQNYKQTEEASALTDLYLQAPWNTVNNSEYRICKHGALHLDTLWSELNVSGDKASHISVIIPEEFGGHDRILAWILPEHSSYL